MREGTGSRPSAPWVRGHRRVKASRVLLPLGSLRRLDILVCFNKAGQEDYGAGLGLWDAAAKHCVACIAPGFDRAEGLATSPMNAHGSAPGGDGVKRSTVFRARPDEYFRGAVMMPAENALRASSRTLRNLKSQVKSILSS